MHYQVYILENIRKQKYIGITNNIQKRLEKHNTNCSKWTAGKGPWSLFWVSKLMLQADARKLEILLKKQKGGQGLKNTNGS